MGAINLCNNHKMVHWWSVPLRKEMLHHLLVVYTFKKRNAAPSVGSEGQKVFFLNRFEKFQNNFSNCLAVSKFRNA